MDTTSDVANVFSLISNFKERISSPQEEPQAITQEENKEEEAPLPKIQENDEEIQENNDEEEGSEHHVWNVIKKYSHHQDIDAYYDAIYEDVIDDTDDEEAGLCDDEEAGLCDDNIDRIDEEADCCYDKTEKEDSGGHVHNIDIVDGSSTDNQEVSHFCSHVSNHEDSECCDHTRSLVSGVSASTPSSARKAPVGRMTDRQLAHRALHNMDIASFNVRIGMDVLQCCHNHYSHQ